jgi:4-hydroxy-tetrahydrodipicolinate synthase
MVRAFLKEEIEVAQKLHYRLLSLAQVLFIETNPIPVKTALAMMHKMDLEFRLPLCPMQPENEAKLKKTLKEYKLI